MMALKEPSFSLANYGNIEYLIHMNPRCRKSAKIPIPPILWISVYLAIVLNQKWIKQLN